MTAKPNMKHLAQEIQVLDESAPPPQAEPAPDREPRELARELVQAFEEAWHKYRRIRERDPEWPDPSQPPPDWQLEGIRHMPAEKVDFFHLERLARVDPAEAVQR